MPPRVIPGMMLRDVEELTDNGPTRPNRQQGEGAAGLAPRLTRERHDG